MKTQIGHGFFVMQDVTTIFNQRDLIEAKAFCNSKISDFAHVYSKTKPQNVEKARMMITRAKTVAGLAQAVSNYVLAHQSEGLKVI